MSLPSLSLPSLVPVTQPRRYGEWRALFRTLPTPARDTLPGRYRGELLGPAWFQGLVRQGLGLLGLRGWWGKDFAAGGRDGVNLVRREGGLSRSVPLVLRDGVSRVDGRASLQVEYPRGAGWQWRPFVDEVRWLEGHTLLAMTHLELPLLRHVIIPFLLHREPTLH